jgi:hypothetical protein
MRDARGAARSRFRVVVVVAVSLVTLSCTPRPQTPFGTPSQAEWTLARSRLEALRAAQPRRPFVEIVRVVLREPSTGRLFEGRGAVAVDPHRAMRMVLLGPGGMTAMDAWTTPDRWRLSIPAIGRVRRGGAEAEGTLPVGFFRWWFLAPYDGRLLTARATPESTVLVLRQGRATITILHETPRAPAGASGLSVPPPYGSLGAQAGLASRREGQSVDRLAWLGKTLSPGEGDRALYEQPSTGLRVQVEVESLSDEPPDPAAFLDPDLAPAPGAAASGPTAVSP